jgi:hypothetical protein
MKMKKQLYYDKERGCYQEIPTKYLNHGLSDKGLIETFPEVKEILPEKLKEWQEKKALFLNDEIKPLLKKTMAIKDKFSRWFSKKIIKAMIGKNLNNINGNIIRLKRLAVLTDRPKNFHSKRKIDYERTVEQARNCPIDKIVSVVIKLKVAGKNYMARCPFHEDKNPSFYVYPDTNSFYCFGCHKGGDVIKFVESYFGYGFKEAVEHIKKNS